MPFRLRRLSKASETTDLPLPGKPVIQTHQPFSKLDYPPSNREDKQNIINLLIKLRNQGYKESTLRTIGYVLKHLSKHVSLNNVEGVKAFISTKNFDSYKKKLADAYALYCQCFGLTFEKPKYKRIHRLPFVPLENEVEAFIGGLSLKYACFCQVIRETGARPVEAWNLKWVDVNSENNCITINNPAKGSNARIVKVSNQTIAMLNQLPRKCMFIFKNSEKSKLEDFTDRIRAKRKKIAMKLGNPRINQITLRSLRHFKATVTYHKTRDILYVKEILGHVSIQNTLVYTHLVNFNENEWVCSVAKTLQEACSLIEQGFEYVTEMDGAKIFRKRK
jgi:integrase